jgi:hypothetical protein
VLTCAIVAATGGFVSVILSDAHAVRGDVAPAATSLVAVPVITPPPVHLHPTTVKGIYVTAYTAGNQVRLDKIIDLIDRTELNAVVIDIKDYTGYILYDSHVPLAEQLHTTKNILGDVPALISRLHEHGIYVIARQTVFQDPVLAKNNPIWAIRDVHGGLWRDRNGLAWVDASVTGVWDYNIAIAKEAAGLGFDEINFDYVRFPTDGNLKNMGFPKWDKKTPRSIVIKNFFKKVRESLSDATLSVDLFGLSAVNSDDLGIGQILENAFDYFDYVCPMLYPSHFASGFLGFENPAEHPYEVVKYATQMALLKKEYYKNALSFTGSVGKLAKIRPWIQDFDLGAVYDEAMVRQQIDAVVDATQKEYVGFMLWSPSNFYTKEALISPAVATH